MFEDVLPEISGRLLSDFDHELKRLGFYLGGGSGLSLQLGHRISEDLDFFTEQTFEPQVVSRYLETRGEYQETLVSPGTLYCMFRKVKLSFIRYPVPLIYPHLAFGSVEVADWRDILAEKFKTLSQRGSRKDFHDLYACFIIRNLSIAEGAEILRRRFAGADINYYHILKSLVYFEDADAEPEPVLVKPLEWQTVKDFFIRNLKEFEKHLLKEELK